MTADNLPVPYQRVQCDADGLTIRFADPVTVLRLSVTDLESLSATVGLIRTASDADDSGPRGSIETDECSQGLVAEWSRRREASVTRAEAIPNLGAMLLSDIEEAE